jgi:hypothetical protein
VTPLAALRKRFRCLLRPSDSMIRVRQWCGQTGMLQCASERDAIECACSTRFALHLAAPQCYTLQAERIAGETVIVLTVAKSPNINSTQHSCAASGGREWTTCLLVSPAAVVNGKELSHAALAGLPVSLAD